ncbi:hypothetical protein NP603_20485 [Methylomonas sp. SURF-1]|uniref:Lipoprotein n=1 Tax=Methylomonas aurea TaxID=2952224 RepID=A0ABT1UQ29_9GAMM|nr:hypothetical protein [Methylomonas sp. SURF-1]MCQ8183501.1 hypothetical protein [Methylomonas sp. SURF-1]
MTSTIVRSLAAAIVFSLTACAPASRPIAISESHRKVLSTDEAHQISFLIRDVLGSRSKRQDVQDLMYQQFQAKQFKSRKEAMAAIPAGGSDPIRNMAEDASFVGAVATGAPLSPAGMDVSTGIGMAGLALSLLTPSAKPADLYKVYGRLYMDESYANSLSIPVTARLDMIRRFETAVRQAGLTATCQDNCGDDKNVRWRVYSLTGGAEPLWAVLRLADMEPAPRDPARDEILGYPVILQSATDKDDSVATAHSLVIRRAPPVPATFDPANQFQDAGQTAWDNPKARQVLRGMTADGHWLFAWCLSEGQHLAAWKGRLFAISQPSYWVDIRNSIDYEILE